MTEQIEFVPEMVDPSSLHAHPRNYQEHPDDQINHIIERIRRYGIYRNIVVTRDNTILAGHGVWKATCKMGLKSIPIIRLDLEPDSPAAMKLLAGDNEVSHLAMKDDRRLTEMLKEIKELDIEGLLGTGFDDMMLANLLFATRPEGEIEDYDAAADWVGMPEYEATTGPIKIIVSFRNEVDRIDFARRLDLRITEKTKSIWWPPKPQKDDQTALKFEQR